MYRNVTNFYILILYPTNLSNSLSSSSHLGFSVCSIISPGNNDTLISNLKWKWKSLSHVWPHGLYSPWNSPGQNTGVSGLLQVIFPTQGSNPGIPHCRQILYQLSHRGSPRKLEWVAYPFSSRSSWPRKRTGLSCNAGVFFTNWAIRKAQYSVFWPREFHGPWDRKESGTTEQLSLSVRWDMISNLDSFSCSLIAVTRTFKIVLKNSGKGGNSCFWS